MGAETTEAASDIEDVISELEDAIKNDVRDILKDAARSSIGLLTHLHHHCAANIPSSS